MGQHATARARRRETAELVTSAAAGSSSQKSLHDAGDLPDPISAEHILTERRSPAFVDSGRTRRRRRAEQLGLLWVKLLSGSQS